MKVTDLLCTESMWTVGAEARTRTGEPVHAEDEKAVCWCLIGAISICYPKFEDREQIIRAVIREISARRHEPTWIDQFNDSTTFSEIRELALKLGI